jgi:beta-galactosidase/beta-glucuronidase
MNIPRPEYPRPQFARTDWLCLNGEWEFEIDAGDSGLERGLKERPLGSRITVPFCPESSLSGIGCVDFMNAAWYRRVVTIPGEWKGRRTLLHFQAIDYDATIWVNGIEVARHRGGSTPVTADLSGVAEPGTDAVIVVRARDDSRASQPRGKQSPEYANFSCLYTRTTGIWQTVWMEPVPRTYLDRPRITPDLAGSLFRLELPMTGDRTGMRLRARLLSGGAEVSRAECQADLDLAPRLDLEVPASARRTWSPSDPHLYDIELDLIDSSGTVVDPARSYAGLRSLSVTGPAVRLNGGIVFQRLVLDQGFYPDGIWTAPTDDAIRRDIELSQAAGFNGARLHQKVFEERFFWHADRLGYLVWGEFPDWGSSGRGPDEDHLRPEPTYVTQWLEVLERDYSHPSIVGWCPLNETWQPTGDQIRVLDDVTRGMFLAAKAMDGTRPVLDASGYAHRVRESDVYDSHDYEQDPVKFRAHHAGLAAGQPYVNRQGGDKPKEISTPWAGQPYFVSEFGGIWWNPEAGPGEDSWGYGKRPASVEEFYARFEALCGVLLDNPLMFGYCYTQLTDVFQEHNGIYYFDRRPKFDLERIRRIQARRAAIELTRRSAAASSAP